LEFLLNFSGNVIIEANILTSSAVTGLHTRKETKKRKRREEGMEDRI
jgi:hypothetical protein